MQGLHGFQKSNRAGLLLPARFTPAHKRHCSPRNYVSVFGSGGDYLPSVGGGGPALSIENNGNSGATVANGTSTYSILSFVVTSANLLLIAVGANDPNSATNGVVVSVKWNTTESATLVAAASQVWPRMELWKLVNPTPGTHSIDIVLSGPVNEYCAGATGFIGANATLGTPVTANAAGTNPATVTFSPGVVKLLTPAAPVRKTGR
jgi:hypothetical protein